MLTPALNGVGSAVPVPAHNLWCSGNNMRSDSGPPVSLCTRAYGAVCIPGSEAGNHTRVRRLLTVPPPSLIASLQCAGTESQVALCASLWQASSPLGCIAGLEAHSCCRG